MPVVRISLGRFDAANYDAIRRLLDDSQKTLDSSDPGTER
jgi:hypothetical protein